MPSGQISTKGFYYLLVVIAAGLTLLYGFNAVQKIRQSSEQLDVSYVAASLQGFIKKSQKGSFGSIEEHILGLPASAEYVCFADRSKNISPLVNCPLNAQLELYPGKDVFISPFSEFSPLAIGGYELDEKENPLCLKASKGVIRLSTTANGPKAVVSTFDSGRKRQDCVAVSAKGNPDDSLDIVFLGLGYTGFDNFAKDVDANMKILLAAEPMRSFGEKINLYRIDRFEEMGCEVGDYIKCDEFEVKKLAASCPHDFVIILASRSKIKDFIKPVRSSSVSNMVKVNTADNPSVIIHEFGHAFGSLADEYVDEKYYSSLGINIASFPNCDYPECRKWSLMEGTGCFEGCSLSSLARPTKNSIMRSLQADEFGVLNEGVMREKLEKYGGPAWQ
ncbi:hypothetical protein HYU14_02080 [Candidatus Woesearchaeota archaeon]|nr:hypothetical protein [Candidatus Woesearchaeota archaeon]